MSTLEDRLLGEKLNYYCSSSEGEDDDGDDEKNNKKNSIIKEPAAATGVSQMNSWEGSSTNTGPKGVLKDWQRFKQLETEQRREQERERIALAKKLALSCRSHLDDEKEKEKEKEEEEEVDRMVDESILRQYILNRMEEMVQNTSNRKIFGQLVVIHSGEEFLEAVDKEDKSVTVVVHLFDPFAPGCEAMNGCLICLAEEYPNIKFCRLEASAAGLSSRFKGTGLPALLVYKGGHLVGNFVRLVDELGEDFFATDLEAFLIEHGILMDKSLQPPGIKGPSITSNNDDDSD